MGIYLPNMEMPRKGQMLVIFPDGTSYVCFNGMRERLAQTEAVPVPPHGDLVDRAEIREIAISLLDKAVTDQEANAIREMWYHLGQMPVFIPAEEGE